MRIGHTNFGVADCCLAVVLIVSVLIVLLILLILVLLVLLILVTVLILVHKEFPPEYFLWYRTGSMRRSL